MLEPLRRLDLADGVVAEGSRCLALTDRGLGMVARRDRAAVGAARQRWSARPVDPKAPLTWRNVSGSRSRQLLRNLEHTQAVHWFLAALAMQSRAWGWQEVRFDPPRRASRFFRHDGDPPLGAARRLRRHRAQRRPAALLPGVGAPRRAPGHNGGPHRPLPALLRHRRPLDDHGAVPLVLVVFDDDIATGHFLRVAQAEMRRAGVKLPLWVSHKGDVLQRLGPLGVAWQSPGEWGPACPFN